MLRVLKHKILLISFAHFFFFVFISKNYLLNVYGHNIHTHLSKKKKENICKIILNGILWLNLLGQQTRI